MSDDAFFDDMRIERAKQQTMYMIDMNINRKKWYGEFKVIGTTGNLYTVKLGHKTSCDCPDFSNNGKFCKHIYFVFIKVFKVDPYDKLRIKIPRPIRKELMNGVPTILAREIVPSASILDKYEQLKHTKAEVKRRDITDDCPICMEPMSGEEGVSWCFAVCGNNFHTACFDRWLQVMAIREPSCVLCRAPLNKSVQKKYINLK